MKTADPTMPSPSDRPGDPDWPFEVKDVDDVLAKIEHRVKQRRVRRRRLSGGIAAVAAIAFAAAWAVPFLRDTSSVATAASHRQSVALADGSQADLNARTRMHTDFRHRRRIVRLTEGEVYFSVAKDPAHPFLVETPSSTVRVTGTQFNVRVTGGRTEVTLLTGAVEIQTADLKLQASPTRLIPGEQITTGVSNVAVRQLDEAGLENVTAWRHGLLGLDGRTLGDAVERLAAYHGRRIAIDQDVATLRTGGTVSLEDLGVALSALEAILPIRVLPVEGGDLQIVAR